MIASPLSPLHHLAHEFLATARGRIARWTRPAAPGITVGAATDATPRSAEAAVIGTGAPPASRARSPRRQCRADTHPVPAGA